MHPDSIYLSSCHRSIDLLLTGANGEWNDIPGHYLDYFHHRYQDDDVSLLPLASKIENTEFLSKEQVDEVIRILSKVDPDDWPDFDSIEAIDAEELLEVQDYPGTGTEEFVEDNLGASEKTQRVLKHVIESVFGKGVSTIRSKMGKFPSPGNNFLMEKDGTFAGTFKFNNLTFEFEIAPTEETWLCTYRLEEGSLDKLEKPEFRGQRNGDKVSHRKIRGRGWR